MCQRPTQKTPMSGRLGIQKVAPDQRLDLIPPKGDARTKLHTKTYQSKGERQDMSQPSPVLSNPF